MSIGLLPKDIWIVIIAPLFDVEDIQSLYRVNRFFRHLINYDECYFTQLIKHVFEWARVYPIYTGKWDLRWFAWTDLQKAVYQQFRQARVCIWLMQKDYFIPSFEWFECLVKQGHVEEARQLIDYRNVDHSWVKITLDYQEYELLAPLLAANFIDFELHQHILWMLLRVCYKARFDSILDFLFDVYIKNKETFKRLITIEHTWNTYHRYDDKIEQYFMNRLDYTKKRKIDQEFS